MTNSALFTLGYENLDYSQFVDKLKQAKVKNLVDVRDYAKSRKKGFSKSELSSFFAENGIEYIHLKELGSPADIRNKLRKDKKYEYFFRKYKNHLAKQDETLDILANIIKSDKTCIFCYEQDFQLCHRKSVASYLNILYEGEFNIVHI